MHSSAEVAGAAGARPDLRVTALAAPRAIVLGAPTGAIVTVRSAAGRTGASRTALLLSRDRRRSAGDRRLGESHLAPASGRRSVSSVVAAAAPKRLRLRRGFLIACADARNVMDAVRGCLRFELDYRFVYSRTSPGDGTVTRNGDLGVNGLVAQFDLAKGAIAGEKALVYNSYTVTHSKSGGIPVTGIEYLDPLRVVRLGLVDAAGRRSVSLGLTPGNTRETYGRSGFSISENNYLNAFRVLFAPEENGPEYTFGSWTPGSGALFGTLTLSRAGQCAPGNPCDATLTMTLRHAPTP